MPTYTYLCPACDHEFQELLWSTESDANVVCPSCGRAAPTRQPPKSFVGRTAAGKPQASAESVPFCGRCGQSRPPCEP